MRNSDLVKITLIWIILRLSISKIPLPSWNVYPGLEERWWTRIMWIDIDSMDRMNTMKATIKLFLFTKRHFRIKTFFSVKRRLRIKPKWSKRAYSRYGLQEWQTTTATTANSDAKRVERTISDTAGRKPTWLTLSGGRGSTIPDGGLDGLTAFSAFSASRSAGNTMLKLYHSNL